VRILRVARLDATSAIPLDVGATLERLITKYDDASIDARARGALDAAVSTAPAVASASPRGTRRSLGFAPTWSVADQTLSVLVVVRFERQLVTEEPNPDPHAGAIWCSAPPGADCAPRCIPRSWRVTWLVVGEAGITAVLARDGEPRRIVVEREGAPRARLLHRDGVGDCR
jgi:hypothetical protein